MKTKLALLLLIAPVALQARGGGAAVGGLLGGLAVGSILANSQPKTTTVIVDKSDTEGTPESSRKYKKLKDSYSDLKDEHEETKNALKETQKELKEVKRQVAEFAKK